MTAPRLLVADDDAAYRAALCAQLRFAGYDVDECADGAEAVERATACEPDLVLLDFDMPRLDGIRALQRLRADARLEGTPILLMSGLDSRTVRVRGLTLGADDFVRKPCDRPELLARIRSALRKGSRSAPAAGGESGLRGRVEQVGLEALLQMLDLGRRSGRLTLEESGGELVLEGGRLVACRYGRFDGQDALGRLLWSAHGRFRFDAPEASDDAGALRSSDGGEHAETARSLQEALLTALATLDHARRALHARGTSQANAVADAAEPLHEESWIERIEPPVPASASRAVGLLPLRARELAILMDGPLDEAAAWIAAAYDEGRLRCARP